MHIYKCMYIYICMYIYMHVYVFTLYTDCKYRIAHIWHISLYNSSIFYPFIDYGFPIKQGLDHGGHHIVIHFGPVVPAEGAVRRVASGP